MKKLLNLAFIGLEMQSILSGPFYDHSNNHEDLLMVELCLIESDFTWKRPKSEVDLMF